MCRPFALFIFLLAPLGTLGVLEDAANATEEVNLEGKNVKGFFNFVKGDGTKETKEPNEEDLVEAADYGIEAMNDLYDVKEPKLYSMGLYTNVFSFYLRGCDHIFRAVFLFLFCQI